jgi:L-alanine-DL-glutamate epimerase-like enolase superfamily enzyme
MSALEMRILIYWTLVATSGDTVVCELCRTADGLEVRCMSHAPSPIRRAPVASAMEASALAAAWKDMYLAGEWSEKRFDDEPVEATAAAGPRTVFEERVKQRGTLRRVRY